MSGCRGLAVHLAGQRLTVFLDDSLNLIDLVVLVLIQFIEFSRVIGVLVAEFNTVLTTFNTNIRMTVKACGPPS